MKNKHIVCIIAALMLPFAFAGCAQNEAAPPPVEDEIVSPEVPAPPLPEPPAEELPPAEEIVPEESPVVKKIKYIKVTGDGVNIRSGPGSGYKSLGAAERNTLYALEGVSGNWYKTYYKGSAAYIYKDYCVPVEFEAGGDMTEAVIAEGAKHMGVKYVYGATRYHNGKGVYLSGFSTQAFDCSSLMQYIFKRQSAGDDAHAGGAGRSRYKRVKAWRPYVLYQRGAQKQDGRRKNRPRCNVSRR